MGGWSFFRLAFAGPGLLAIGVVAGLAREVALAAAYGSSETLDSFRIALAVPNIFAQSVAPVLVATFARVSVNAVNGDGRDLSTLRHLQLGSIAVAVFLVVSVSLFGERIAAVLAPGFSGDLNTLTKINLMLLSLAAAILLVTVPARALLTAQTRIWVGNIAPATVALAVCASLGVGHAAGLIGYLRAFVPATGFLLGALLVAVTHMWALKRSGFALTLPRCTHVKILVAILAPAGLAVCVHVLNSIPRLLDRAAASYLDAGSVAALEYSFAVVSALGMVIGTGCVTMAISLLSRDREHPVARIRIISSFAVLFSAGVAVAGYFNAQSVIELIYGRGAFGASAAAQTVDVFRFHIAALPFIVSGVIFFSLALVYSERAAVVVYVLAKVGARSLLVTWGSIASLADVGFALLASEGLAVLIGCGVLLGRRVIRHRRAS